MKEVYNYNDTEQDNQTLHAAIKNSNFVFDKKSFFKKLGIIAASSFTVVTAAAFYGADMLPFLDSATYGLYAMGGLTATVGVVDGVKIKKASNISKKAVSMLNTIVSNIDGLVLDDSDREKMIEALKSSEITSMYNKLGLEIPIEGDKTIDLPIAKTVDDIAFASPVTDLNATGETFMFMQPKKYSYAFDGTVTNEEIGPVCLVEEKDHSDPKYADKLANVTNSFSGYRSVRIKSINK